MLKAKITFAKKPGINLHSLHSKAEGWEGKNVLFWVMDEASAFRSANDVDNADTVYKSLRSSAQSRFAWAHWIGFVISFPRKQTGDFTLKKYEASKTNPNIYGDTGCTWEINPRWEKGHPMYQAHSDEWVIIEDLNVRVPVEFKEDFETDGVDAMTKYMAQPPLTEGGFFENPVTIKEAVNRELQPIIADVGQREKELDTGGTRRYVTREIVSLPPKVEGQHYFMHGDPGLKQDAFSIAVAHTMPESKTLNETATREVQMQKVVVDFVLSWVPRPNRPVDLLNVDEVMLMLCKHYDIKQVTFDRWNSANSIQKLVAEGIDANDMSFSNAEQLAMYRYLRLGFYNDMIELAPGDEDTQGWTPRSLFDRAGIEKFAREIGPLPNFGRWAGGCLAFSVCHSSLTLVAITKLSEPKFDEVDPFRPAPEASERYERHPQGQAAKRHMVPTRPLLRRTAQRHQGAPRHAPQP